MAVIQATMGYWLSITPDTVFDLKWFCVAIALKYISAPSESKKGHFLKYRCRVIGGGVVIRVKSTVFVIDKHHQRNNVGYVGLRRRLSTQVTTPPRITLHILCNCKKQVW